MGAAKRGCEMIDGVAGWMVLFMAYFLPLPCSLTSSRCIAQDCSEVPGQFSFANLLFEADGPGAFRLQHFQKVFAFDQVDSLNVGGGGGEPGGALRDLRIEAAHALLELTSRLFGFEVNEEAHGRHEFGRLAARSRDNPAQGVLELIEPGGREAVGGALGPIAFATGGLDGDQTGLQKAPNGVIERSALEREDLILVPETEEALHLVRVHGGLAEEGENGDFPETEFGCHIVHLNYIK